MIFRKHLYTFIAAFTFCAIAASAQDKPIGYWEAHLPYNKAVGVATDGNNVYAICQQAFFTLSTANYQITPYSKVEGMSDIGMQCGAYDMATSTCVLVYSDGNIDLFKDNTFYNIPDLKIKTVAGAKTVNQIYTENGVAYLSTSLGVILIDLTTHNITETYQFIANSQVTPVTSFIGSGDYFYALTPTGLYRASKNSPALQDFQMWQNIDSTDTFVNTASVNNVLFLANRNKVFTFINDTFRLVYTAPTSVTHINAGLNTLLIGERYQSYNGKVKKLDINYNIVDSFEVQGYTVQAVQLLDSTIWVASGNGLQKRTGINQAGPYAPPGPFDFNSYDIYAYNKDVWIAHGGYTDGYVDLGIGVGISNLNNGTWKSYYQYGYEPFDTMQDFVSIVKDETDGTLYTGSFEDGLFILNADGTHQTIKQNLFDSSTSAYGSGQRQVIGTAVDHQDNVWVALYHSAHQLYAKSKDSVWYKFTFPGAGSGGPITVDNNNQIWFACTYASGLVVFNYNGTLSDPSDDAYYLLQKGAGSGNLPGSTVFCTAVDKNNNVWIGTDNGIGIASGCTGPFTQQSPPCDVEIPIVQYDQFAGYLFSGNNVRTIAVDGANRKWVGTDNGVWLLSPDASKIVYRFTADNSPLPSNNIQKITIDKITGDVYIGTDQGLVTYHSTAVDGGTTNQNVLTFPNPVPSGYTGTIAIKGLVADADVRITDISGQLVYRTIALGGQAVWNGMDYKGHRPESGVYLIFVSSADGSQTYTGKMVFMQ